MAKVGMSFVSDGNAKANWQSEIPDFNFDGVRAATHAAWNTFLGKIEVAGGTADQRTVFYSNLYHILNHPNVVSDVNGQYMGYDNKVHTVVSGQQAHYENFSGWDIYHNEASLAALLAPKETGDMGTSLMQAFQQSGAIPQWGFMNSFNGVMIGDSAPAIVAQYHAFGARSADDNQLLQDLVHQARVDNRIRGGLAEYDRLGFKPDDPSLTIEWTQEDFALSRLAAALGDTTDADFLLKRSLDWKNILDPQTGLLSPRHSNGQFVHVQPDDTSGAYVEGSATQYRFQVPNDQPALAAMLGGNGPTNSLLDSMFQSFDGETPTRSLLTNEFSQGQQWFYNWTGMPSHTQEVVHRWLTTTYANDCCTFPNNDDLGTMSAQYVWASMGIYPENLGTTDVTLNSPLFTQVLIHLMNGNTITINAPQASSSNFFIQSVAVNGTSQTKTWIPGSLFTNGGTVDFTLGSSASTWGTGANDAPPSYDGGVTQPPPGNNNLALNRPATSGSATCNSNETAAKAVNGSVSGGLTDKWCSSGTPRTLTVDLGSSMALTSFIVRHAGAGGESASLNTKDYDLQVSNDGSTFTTVGQVRGNTANVTTTQVSASGRFVRLNVITPAQTTDTHARIYEFEAYGNGSQPPPGGNLALNRPATGSTPCNSTETPDKAVNGSVSGGTSDKFCSTDATKFLQVDLGSSLHLSHLTIRHAGAGGEFNGWDTQDFDLQVSTDGSTFTTVAQVRGNTADVTDTAVNATGRFVRLNILQAEQGSGSAGAARIYELEVFG